jgi:hypothetical protein
MLFWIAIIPLILAIFVFGKNPSGLDIGLVVGGYLVALLTARHIRSSGGSDSIIDTISMTVGTIVAIVGIIRVFIS